MDYIRKFKGWQRALRKFQEKHPPVPQGFRAPELTIEQAAEMEQTRRRRAAQQRNDNRRDFLAGCEFGRLLVWDLATLDHSPWWWCLCACGNFLRVSALRLLRGQATHCGCLIRERRRVAKLRAAA